MTPNHDITGPVSLASAVTLAGVPWISNLELGLRILALVLSVAASWYAIKHYRAK
jgi:hypothetical protein